MKTRQNVEQQEQIGATQSSSSTAFNPLHQGTLSYTSQSALFGSCTLISLDDTGFASSLGRSVGSAGTGQIMGARHSDAPNGMCE